MTADKILAHPVGHNIKWRDVVSLLRSVGEVDEHDGRVRVTMGDETETFDIPHHGDIDAQQVIDLRRMLTGVGITSATDA